MTLRQTRYGSKLPEAGILLLLAVDQFLDMGRTATNVMGNSIATAVIARTEGNKHDLPEEENIAVDDKQRWSHMFEQLKAYL